MANVTDKDAIKGLVYIDEKLGPAAEEIYNDERTRKVLDPHHTPDAADLDLVGDMIKKLKSL